MRRARFGFAVFGVSFFILLSGIIVQTASSADEQQTLDLLKTFHTEFVSITPGDKGFPKSFVMGTETGPPAEGPAHTVSFDYAFAMAKYEVPQNLFEAVMGKNPSKWKGAAQFSRDVRTFMPPRPLPCQKATEALHARREAADRR